MTTKKKFTKIIIILILFVFLVITWLSAIVPYMWGNTNTIQTGDVVSWTTVVETWVNVPAVDLSGTELSGLVK